MHYFVLCLLCKFFYMIYLSCFILTTSTTFFNQIPLSILWNVPRLHYILLPTNHFHINMIYASHSFKRNAVHSGFLYEGETYIIKYTTRVHMYGYMHDQVFIYKNISIIPVNGLFRKVGRRSIFFIDFFSIYSLQYSIILISSCLPFYHLRPWNTVAKLILHFLFIFKDKFGIHEHPSTGELYASQKIFKAHDGTYTYTISTGILHSSLYI